MINYSKYLLKNSHNNEVKIKINRIFVFFNPEYLNIWIWSSFIRFVKKTWVDIRKINGNISNSKEGELSNDK